MRPIRRQWESRWIPCSCSDDELRAWTIAVLLAAEINHPARAKAYKTFFVALVQYINLFLGHIWLFPLRIQYPWTPTHSVFFPGPHVISHYLTLIPRGWMYVDKNWTDLKGVVFPPWFRSPQPPECAGVEQLWDNMCRRRERNRCLLCSRVRTRSFWQQTRRLAWGKVFMLLHFGDFCRIPGSHLRFLSLCRKIKNGPLQLFYGDFSINIVIANLFFINMKSTGEHWEVNKTTEV